MGMNGGQKEGMMVSVTFGLRLLIYFILYFIVRFFRYFQYRCEEILP